MITFQIRDGASRRKPENTTTVLASCVHLNGNGDVIGFLRKTGQLNGGYIQDIIGPYPQVKILYRFISIL